MAPLKINEVNRDVGYVSFCPVETNIILRYYCGRTYFMEESETDFNTRLETPDDKYFMLLADILETVC